MRKLNPVQMVVPIAIVTVTILLCTCDGRQSPQGAASTSPSTQAHDPWASVQPVIERHDAELAKTVAGAIEPLENFFKQAEDRSDESRGPKVFAENALSWKSKWLTLTDQVRGREDLQNYLQEQFEKSVFRSDELHQLLASSARSLELALETNDNTLLRDVRQAVELDGVSLDATSLDLAKANQELLDRARAMAQRDAVITLAVTATSFTACDAIVVAVLNALLPRMGVTSGLAVIGASTSWATFGASMVACILASFLVDIVIEWFYDPQIDLEETVVGGIRELRDRVIKGDADAWQIYDELRKMETNDPDDQVKSAAKASADDIASSGALGLQFMWQGHVTARMNSRQQVIKQIVTGGGS